MKLSIWFFMDSVPFTDRVIQGQSSLGGSESACLGVAKGLLDRGHDVKIIATQLERQQTHEGMEWIDASVLPDMLKFAEPDVFVSLRSVAPLKLRLASKLTVLWNQDLLVMPYGNEIVGSLSQVDKLVFVSEYHRDQWATQHPWMQRLSYVTRNPVALPDYQPHDDRRPHHFIYISRPERGLKPLLEMWPRIRDRWPDATLAVARYRSMYDGEGSNVARMCENFDQQTDRVNQDVGGIERLGDLSKTDLYLEMNRATYMLYPGINSFAETNCIAASEAQLTGTLFLGSYKGAIPETLHPDAGLLIDGDAETPEYQDFFLQRLIELVDGPEERRESMRQAGYNWVRDRYSAKTVAREWDEWLHHTFMERYETQKPAVMRQLMHWDQAVAAKIVADEIVADHEAAPTDVLEAQETSALCQRVIDQEEHTAEGYAKHAIKDAVGESRANVRLHVAAQRLLEGKPKTVLDVACGNGAMALYLSQQDEQVTVSGIDYSDGVLKLAREGAKRLKVNDRLTFERVSYDEFVSDDKKQYDAVFCGEFLEHLERPWELLDQLEKACAPDGVIVLTTPCGPFAELLAPNMEHQRGHTHAFSIQDIATMLQGKRDYQWRYLAEGTSPRGTPVGYWLISYRPGGDAARPIDYDKLITTTRPYQRLTASMIVKDEADWLRTCLKSLWGIVDKVVIYDSGSTDGSQQIAKLFGAEVVEGPWPDHFGKARNIALDLVESQTEWVLWVDADEQLVNGDVLRRFIDHDTGFDAYILRQVHLAIDRDTHEDRPQRLFRTGKGVRFYGHVHEQPEQGPDKNIEPSMDLSDRNAPKFMHLGYWDDGIRRHKLLTRNLRLLDRELQSDDPRELAYVLAIRDHCNLAMFEKEANGGRLTGRAQAGYQKAIDLMNEHGFKNPEHKYHLLAYPYYESALQSLGMGVTAKWGFAAREGVRLPGQPKTEQIWAASVEELKFVTTGRIRKWCETIEVKPVDTRPRPRETDARMTRLELIGESG